MNFKEYLNEVLNEKSLYDYFDVPADKKYKGKDIDMMRFRDKSLKETEVKILDERSGKDIYAISGIINDSSHPLYKEKIYMCKDGGSFYVIKIGARESFDEWLNDFDNKKELEDEGII